MSYRFEDYKVITGRTNAGNRPYATLEEFAGLVGVGDSPQEALENLRKRYEERVTLHRSTGKPIPAPGSGKAYLDFAPDDKIRALGLIVQDFWENILGTSLATSFVSNESRLDAWEHYCGGRDILISRVSQRYGVDISACYSAPVPEILKKLKDGAVWKAIHPDHGDRKLWWGLFGFGKK